MRTDSYILPLSDKTANVIRRIALIVPCFISLCDALDGYGKYTIEARQEDWGWIEKQLASIV